MVGWDRLSGGGDGSDRASTPMLTRVPGPALFPGVLSTGPGESRVGEEMPYAGSVRQVMSELSVVSVVTGETTAQPGVTGDDGPYHPTRRHWTARGSGGAGFEGSVQNTETSVRRSPNSRQVDSPGPEGANEAPRTFSDWSAIREYPPCPRGFHPGRTTWRYGARELGVAMPSTTHDGDSGAGRPTPHIHRDPGCPDVDGRGVASARGPHDCAGRGGVALSADRPDRRSTAREVPSFSWYYG